MKPCAVSVLLLTVGLVAGAERVVAAPQGGHEHNGHAMAAMPSMARLEKAERGREFEVAFLSEMIAHHQGGIQMSRMALKRARRSEVKASARKIIAEQTKEISQMQNWLRRWHRRGPDPQAQALVKADSASMMAEFESECRTNCDRAFLKHMAHHHQMGVPMARMAVEKSTHEPLRRLAQKIAKEQEVEAKKFESWLAKEQ